MDLQEVLKLLELMEEHGLDEVEVEQGGKRIRLKKSCPVIAPAPVIVQAPPPAAASAHPAPAQAAPPAEDKDLARIVSPMVGTFYRAPSPDAESFVNAGDAVHAEQVVCIIEAMKVMNEIKAEMEGEIVEVLVDNGESVEYGQPLFTVRRPGAAKQ
jgi:acetyl-CoA carboxylase biotin carboxyl carrier protein